MNDNISLAEEDKLLFSRINDMVRLAGKRGSVYSFFLNARECVAAETELKRLMYDNYCFYGVFKNAERKMLCVFKEYFYPENSDFPMTCLTFSYRKGNVLSHRDFLGAIMSLGLKRETVGDIVIDDGMAQIAVSDSVKEVIMNDIRKIGSVGVSIFEQYETILEKIQEFIEIKGTVASLRLDSVLSFVLNMSRSRISAIIKGIGVEVNYFTKYDGSCNLSQGDIISVKGFGKYRLELVSGITKKGRIHITVFKYC